MKKKMIETDDDKRRTCIQTEVTEREREINKLETLRHYLWKTM